MRIKIAYMYRDGANYKRRSEAIFANPDEWSPREIFARFLVVTEKWQLFAETIHFRPETVGLVTCYFTDIGYPPNDDDILLHEVDQIEETSDPLTDARSIWACPALVDIGFMMPRLLADTAARTQAG